MILVGVEFNTVLKLHSLLEKMMPLVNFFDFSYFQETAFKYIITMWPANDVAASVIMKTCLCTVIWIVNSVQKRFQNCKHLTLLLPACVT